MERGAVLFKAVWYSSSSHSFSSIHICSLPFYEWNDTRGHHGAALGHGCSPRHSQWWVVSPVLAALLDARLRWVVILLMMMMLLLLIMRMMVMLAYPTMMRCILDTFTLCHSWQKGGLVLIMRVVIHRGRVSVGDFCWGGVHIEGCSEDYLYPFLFFLFDIYLFLYLRSCDHYWHTLYLFSLYVDVCFFHLSLHVLFLLFLYTHDSYYLYAIYYFCFTQRCLDEFCLKCFRNTGC